MELKHSHVVAAASLTLVICVASWVVAFKMLDENAGKNRQPSQTSAQVQAAAQQQARQDQNATASADSLLDDIAEPPPASDAVKALGDEHPVQPARDWAAIKKYGQLRVALLPREGPDGISSTLMPEDFERALLTGFARQNRLGVERVIVRRFEDLQGALLDGRCDVVAATYAITPERQKLFAFSSPFRHTAEQIVVSSRKVPAGKDLDLLRGKTGVIQSGTTYWDDMKELSASHPFLKYEPAPEGLEPEALLARVGVGRYDYTVVDDIYLKNRLSRRDDLRAIYNFPEGRDIAWPVRKESKELKKRLDSYLADVAAKQDGLVDGVNEDLPAIKKRGYLRVLTRNTPYCYFIHRGRAMGFEYEFVAEFAKEQGLIPVMLVAPEWDDMRPWLLEGKGDLIAANITRNAIRGTDPKVVFSNPYGSVQQMLVGRSSEKAFKSIADLKGRSVAVRRTSSYWMTLDDLQKAGNDFKIDIVPEDVETSSVIAKVASGEYDLTIVDEPILNAEISLGRKVKPLLAVSRPESYAWIVPACCPKLQEAVNAFIKKQSRPPSYRSVFFNTVYRKYYQNIETAAVADKELTRGPAKELSPYDEIFKRYGERYGVNWLMLAAQSFQESQFNPNATSYVGTQGLMQVHPNTGADLGFTNLRDPDCNIHAGVRYMRLQLERVYSPKMQEKDVACFALACYNAGYGHILDAKILAEEMGLDPNKWFNNVEDALMKLSEAKYAKRAKYGYCKATETYGYVRAIMARFKHYSEIMKQPAQKDKSGAPILPDVD